VSVALLAAISLWPYPLLDSTTNLIFLVSVSFVATVAYPTVVPRLSWQIIATLAYFATTLIVLVSTRDVNAYTSSQINHYVQFAVYYYAFSKMAQHSDWASLLSSRSTLLLLAAAVFVQYLIYRSDDINISLMSLLVGMFTAGHRGRRLTYFLLMFVTTAVIAWYIDRVSVHFVSFIFITLYWIRLPDRVTIIFSLAILVLPVVFYLACEPDAIRWLYRLDPNTGIRAEFIRGASSLLQESPIFGTGFGGPYRPPNFSYVHEHNLLNDVAAVHIVSNHNSLFDIALRLGVPVAILFALGIFNVSKQARASPTFPLLCLVVAAGLSFNAWFENQAQLPQLVLALAFMHAGQPAAGFRAAKPHNSIA
jgi:hypothetical protein